MSLLQCETCTFINHCLIYKHRYNQKLTKFVEAYCPEHETKVIYTHLRGIDLSSAMVIPPSSYCDTQELIERRQLKSYTQNMFKQQHGKSLPEPSTPMLDYRNICSYCKKGTYLRCTVRSVDLRKCASFEPKQINQKLPNRDSIVTKDDIVDLKIDIETKEF